MLKEQDTFHTSNVRRQILIADDEAVNRELLGLVLQADYEVLYAADGLETLEMIQLRRDTLSLVILDLMMPGMNGLALLERLRGDAELSRIPVIVMTSESAAEVESLRLGAIDFIPKPYPQPEVILARVLRTIELREDREIIRETERDQLTGLYNAEYFYRYAEQLDQFYRDRDMDAIVLDINHFHTVNERYGKNYGDRLLVHIAGRILDEVRPLGGIACRRDSDTFLVYCPHREDHTALMESASVTMESDQQAVQVRLRMGVYARSDKAIDVERRFDRAKLAADTLRNNYARQIALYDHTLHEAELYAEQLADDFPKALREKQFRVFFQPKYDIRGPKPVLASAEALVRWQHPRLGLVSPGTFIPLFESNGMIRALDHYVWRETLEQIRAWRERFGRTVPVSVNMSRMDMFDTNLVETLTQMVADSGCTPGDLLLEITESAYTNDSDLILSTVRALRKVGFQIEMDDFGTGYSSLAMLSQLPIDSLKLDMMFVRNAFGDRRDVRLLELIIDISDYLGVPVIAEGVETEEQQRSLKQMGCEFVQGYYFSKPVPAQDFESFLKEWVDEPKSGEAARDVTAVETGASCEQAMIRIAQALLEDQQNVYLVEPDSGNYLEFIPDGTAVGRKPVRRSGDFYGEGRRAFLERVDPEDIAVAERFFEASQIRKGGTSAIFRLRFGDTSRYMNARSILVVEGYTRYLVIAVSDVDEQTRREQERLQELRHAREAANRDPLTGVKNRRAFLDAERDWNERRAEGDADPFSIVVCDVNGLKHTNDTFGHNAGDTLIRSASHIICTIFKHSPVYRIGGDEFVALLRGEDYLARSVLIQELAERVEQNLISGDPVVAFGISDYDPRSDTSMEDVFDRADAAMYACKSVQKEAQTPGD